MRSTVWAVLMFKVGERGSISLGHINEEQKFSALLFGCLWETRTFVCWAKIPIIIIIIFAITFASLLPTNKLNVSGNFVQE